MKAFSIIATPHRDILEGKLTMDVFAAKLWDVAKNRGPDEYKDPETFFRKTYPTEGLKNLFSVVEKRLKGGGGDPVIQIQTPFGGGKTHALIGMYHKAAEWETKKVVVVGTALGMEETLWRLLQKQLNGKASTFTGPVSPGQEAIRQLLYENQPVLILMDEILEYVTKAAGVKVGESTLAAQTIAFMHELTEAVSGLERVCLVVTLPSGLTERYDERAEILYQSLQKVAGRIEKIYTPVQEYEITKIIRRRLFADIDEEGIRKAVAEFMKYAEKEEILPAGSQPSEYRDRFFDSYPFIPEVVDILYHRWGSYPTFQRTRGVLRLLSLVIHSLKAANRPYISLADFDLANQDIRQELLKHIGQEFNGVIGNDITDWEAGSQKVDASLGKTYRGLRLGSRAATTMFLYSFPDRPERGASVSEIKRCATTIENPSSAVVEALDNLKSKLFFLQNVNDKYFFSSQPNLNRILLTNMENISDERVNQMERELLRSGISGTKLKVFLWEENPFNIADSEELKLVVLRRENKEVIASILKSKGQIPRVYRNTLFFLYPLESDRSTFANLVKRKIAYEYIDQDRNLNLNEEQKKEVKNQLKRAESDLKEAIRRFYRIVAALTKDGLKDIDLGIPTYGEEKALDQEVFDKLRSEGEILGQIAPLVLKEKYLSDKDHVLTEQIYQSSLKTPGETRPISKMVLEQGIAEGVSKGLFGLGELEDSKPVCRYFKEQPSVSFSETEVIIRETLCKEQRAKEEAGVQQFVPTPELGTATKIGEEITWGTPGIHAKARDKIHLRFIVPKGKVSNLMGVMNLLQSKFDNLEIELVAHGGEISEQDYEDKIKEAFRQLGIDI